MYDRIKYGSAYYVVIMMNITTSALLQISHEYYIDSQ